MAIMAGIWWLKEGKKGASLDLRSPETIGPRKPLRRLRSAESPERVEYERARLNGEALEGFYKWRQQQKDVALKEAREAWLEEQSALGLIHRSTKRPCLHRDQLTEHTRFHEVVSDLGLLPEEAALFRRCIDLNANVSWFRRCVYLEGVQDKNGDELKDNVDAVRRLDREWSALHASVEHEYLATERTRLDESHRGNPYTVEFLPESEDARYPWLSGYWRATSKDWALTVEWYDKDGRPIEARAPSLNGAVVALFRQIEEARAKNRIRRRA